MAVVDKYIDPFIAKGSYTSPAFNSGADTFGMTQVFDIQGPEVGFAKHRVLRNLDPDYIMTAGRWWGIRLGPSGSETYHVILMKPKRFVDEDLLGEDTLNGLYEFSIGTFGVFGAEKDAPIDILGGKPIADLQVPLYQLAGHTLRNRLPGYDIALSNFININAGQSYRFGLELKFTKG